MTEIVLHFADFLGVVSDLLLLSSLACMFLILFTGYPVVQLMWLLFGMSVLIALSISVEFGV